MWSFGRAYAQRVGTTHKLEISSYASEGGDYYLHKYAMHRLATPPTVISPREFESADLKIQINEKRLRYNAAIWDIGIDHLYFSVYAADYRYSLPVISKLRAELNPIVEMKGEFADLYDEMRDGETISLHVRLQDYLRNPNCLILPVEYYRKALAIVAGSVKRPRVYLFTDQPELVVSAGFDPGLPYTIVSNGSERNLEDMSLMTACKHHVVANSSYSFWGAWLDGKVGGITVVPDLYHRPDCKQLLDTYGEVTQPSYPTGWNVVPVR